MRRLLAIVLVAVSAGHPSAQAPKPSFEEATITGVERPNRQRRELTTTRLFDQTNRSPANRNSLPDSEKRPNCGNNLLTGRINPPNMTWSAVRIDTRGIAEALAGYFRRPVVDRTGLTGFFDIQIDLPPLSPATSPDGGPDSGPSVFTVLQEQLGLRVEEGRGPVEVLVVDPLEWPTDN